MNTCVPTLDKVFIYFYFLVLYKNVRQFNTNVLYTTQLLPFWIKCLCRACDHKKKEDQRKKHTKKFKGKVHIYTDSR